MATCFGMGWLLYLCEVRAVAITALFAASGYMFKCSVKAVLFLACFCGGVEGPGQPMPGTAQCFGGDFW